MERFKALGLHHITANPTASGQSLPGFVSRTLLRAAVYVEDQGLIDVAEPHHPAEYLWAWEPINRLAIYYRIAADGSLRVCRTRGALGYREHTIRDAAGVYAPYYL